MIPIQERDSTAPSQRLGKQFPKWPALMAIVVSLMLAGAAAHSDAQQTSHKRHTYVPPKGFISDSITAVRVAEVVLIPVWGRDEIVAQRPLVAKLQKGVWIVRGNPPEGTVGGVVELEIVRKDGRMLRTWFSK